jgi:hypothetical protein
VGTFLWLLLGGAAAGLATSVATSLGSHDPFSSRLFIPIVFITVVWTLVVNGFSRETKIQESMLVTLVDGSPLNKHPEEHRQKKIPAHKRSSE